jgi:hypothetical protein
MEECVCDLKALLPSDPDLLRACRSALSEAKTPLSQQLLSLREAVEEILPPRVVEDGEVGTEMMAGIGEVGVAGGIEVGLAEGMEVGVAGVQGVDEVAVEAVMVDGDLEGVGRAVFAGDSAGPSELALEVVADGNGERWDGGEQVGEHEKGAGNIVSNADFPSSGLPFHSALEGEPDLDATLLQGNEMEFSHSNPVVMDSDPIVVNSEPTSDPITNHTSLSGVNGADSVPQVNSLQRHAALDSVDGVVRSQSKVIPLPSQNHCPPAVNGTKHSDSTPSSSAGGSVGQLSLSREVSVDFAVSGSAEVGKITGHVQSLGGDQDDVVAVPMIVRSTSTG